MDGGHYFSEEPAAASKPRRVTLALPDVSFDLDTDTGVFSPTRVDPGTRILLGATPTHIPDARELVDLGSGYGPIALTMAARHPEARVWAVEPNSRARALCASNARHAELDNVVVVAPDDVPTDLVIDGLWSNPPIRIGKAALKSLLVEWLTRVRRGSSAWLVVNRHLGADSLATWLTDGGWTVERRASRQGFRVLEVSSRGESDLN